VNNIKKKKIYRTLKIDNPYKKSINYLKFYDLLLSRSVIVEQSE